MGSSCSSAQKKKKEKNKKTSSPPDSRRQSTESIPYGKEPVQTLDTSNATASSPPVSSPPPGQCVQPSSPVVKEVVQTDVRPKAVHHLLMGRIPDEVLHLPLPNNEIVLYVCGDFQESGLEMVSLYNLVYPHLRSYCAFRGYELRVVDPHYGAGDCAEDISYLCLNTLTGLRSMHLIGLILLHDYLGESRPWNWMPANRVSEETLAHPLFHQWFRREGETYQLRPFAERFSDECQKDWAIIETFLNRDEGLMAWHRSQGDPDMETEIHALVGEEGRNCIWVQRRMTHLPAGTAPRSGPNQAGLDRCRSLLQDRLPDSQKLVFYAKWHPDGLHLPEHKPYLQEMCETLREELCKLADVLIEENVQEESQLEYPGIERQLHLELYQQTCHLQQLTQDSYSRPNLESEVKTFLEKNCPSPLVIHGVSGSGKTVLMARLTKLIAQWFPTSAIVVRIVGTSPDSSDLDRLLLSMGEQCCALFKEHPSFAFENQREPLRTLLQKVSRPLVIILDGLDQLDNHGQDLVSWVPSQLPTNVSLVLSVTSNTVEHEALKELLKDESSFIEIPESDQELCLKIFSRGLDQNRSPLNSLAPDILTNVLCLPRTAELSAYIRHPSSIPPINDIMTQDESMKILLKCANDSLTPPLVNFVLELFLNCQFGLSESELLELLSLWRHNKFIFEKNCPYAIWNLFLMWLKSFFKLRVVGGQTLVYWRSHTFRQYIVNYLPKITQATDLIARYFREMPILYGNFPNRRKLDEVVLTKCELFDFDWFEAKLKGTDPFVMLDNIIKIKESSTDTDLMLLFEFIQLSAYALRYDGTQVYAQAYGRLKSCENGAPGVKKIFQRACRPPFNSLLPFTPCLRGVNEQTPVTPDTDAPSSPFTQLYTMPNDPSLMIALCPDGGRVVLCNVFKQMTVRTLTGVDQPRDLRLVSDNRALVLCNRELKLFDLNKGKMIIKLKGVMNQKMAYFGLHDSNYVVALSRNRMYVNMFNLTTGDLETTFKVGEDRFLNSLLVSANGKICVCGDETQKPFPLLVWNLESRKLIHDLRIPHHEFITRLAAISDDGHYVASVCREIHDSAPSFIVVYELESGTLFKKWKPESNSCSIAISSQGSCVVNGLMNTWVLVWDLSTGARRHTLHGHCAPVDQIRLNESGTRCATFDSTGRDRSVRVWNIVRGECEAVFTPDHQILCCQLSIDGQALVLGLEGRNELVTLLLCKDTAPDEYNYPTVPYGDLDKQGKVIDVNEDG